MTTSTLFPSNIPFLLLGICYNQILKINRLQGRSGFFQGFSWPLLPSNSYKDFAEKANCRTAHRHPSGLPGPWGRRPGRGSPFLWAVGGISDRCTYSPDFLISRRNGL